jgi:phosphonopyruvate decarboxylase
MKYYGVPDSKLSDWLRDKEYLVTADEGEAVAMAAGYYLATGKLATVFMNADGFLNALVPLTSLIIPYQIPISWVISTGRQEVQHKVASDSLQSIIDLYVYQGAGDFALIK